MRLSLITRILMAATFYEKTHQAHTAKIMIRMEVHVGLDRIHFLFTILLCSLHLPTV